MIDVVDAGQGVRAVRLHGAQAVEGRIPTGLDGRGQQAGVAVAQEQGGNAETALGEEVHLVQVPVAGRLVHHGLEASQGHDESLGIMLQAAGLGMADGRHQGLGPVRHGTGIRQVLAAGVRGGIGLFGGGIRQGVVGEEVRRTTGEAGETVGGCRGGDGDGGARQTGLDGVEGSGGLAETGRRAVQAGVLQGPLQHGAAQALAIRRRGQGRNAARQAGDAGGQGGIGGIVGELDLRQGAGGPRVHGLAGEAPPPGRHRREGLAHGRQARVHGQGGAGTDGPGRHAGLEGDHRRPGAAVGGGFQTEGPAEGPRHQADHGDGPGRAQVAGQGRVGATAGVRCRHPTGGRAAIDGVGRHGGPIQGAGRRGRRDGHHAVHSEQAEGKTTEDEAADEGHGGREARDPVSLHHAARQDVQTCWILNGAGAGVPGAGSATRWDPGRHRPPGGPRPADGRDPAGRPRR